MLASPKRSFNVLTSAQEKRDVLEQRNKTSRSRAACLLKEREASMGWEGAASTSGPTGPWPGWDSWSHWSLWLQLHPTPRDPDCPWSMEQFSPGSLSGSMKERALEDQVEGMVAGTMMET